MSGQKSGGGDSDLGSLLAAAAVMGLLYLIWYLGRDYFLWILRWIRYGELWIMHLFKPYIYLQNGANRVVDVMDALATMPPDQLNWPILAKLETALIWQFYQWPIIIALSAMALWGLLFSNETQMRKVYTLEKLIKQQGKMWPVIMPALRFNPIIQKQRVPGSPLSAELPMFAEALSPEEWLSYNNIPIANGVVDPIAAAKALMPQLGPRWQGLKGNPPYILGLMAAFALKGGRKRIQSDDLLGELALCWNPKSGFKMGWKLRNKIDGILKDPKIGPPALEMMDKHFYRTTGLMRLLLWARERGGVLAPATFLWLRAVDRALWYPLNNTGRRTFHAEAGGAAAHYFAEIGLGRPLPMPKLDAAIASLNTYVAEFSPTLPENARSKKSKGQKK